MLVGGERGGRGTKVLATISWYIVLATTILFAVLISVVSNRSGLGEGMERKGVVLVTVEVIVNSSVAHFCDRAGLGGDGRVRRVQYLY